MRCSKRMRNPVCPRPHAELVVFIRRRPIYPSDATNLRRSTSWGLMAVTRTLRSAPDTL